MLKKRSVVASNTKQLLYGVIIFFLVMNQFYVISSFNNLQANVLQPSSEFTPEVLITSEISQLRSEISTLIQTFNSSMSTSVATLASISAPEPAFNKKCVLNNTQVLDGMDLSAESADTLEECYDKCLKAPECEWIAYSFVYNCPRCCYLKKGDVGFKTKLNWVAVPRICQYESVFEFLKYLSPRRGDEIPDDDEELLELNMKSEDLTMVDLNLPEIYNDGDTSKSMQFKLLFGKHDGSSNAIFAIAAGYAIQKYEYFVGSARRAGFKGDIVLGIRSSENTADIEEYLKKLNVIAYNVPDNVHFASWRYYAYYYWSLQYADSAYIWLLDFRDSLFQDHPFPKKFFKDPSVELYVMEEVQLLTLKECEHNTGWIQACCGGNKALQKVGNNWILNSGATAGIPHGIQVYSLSMLTFFKQIKEKFPDGFNFEMTGIDQGLHNWLFRTNQINVNFEVLQQGHGPCNVVGYFTISRTGIGHLFDEEGLITNADGSVSPIIHQFDRFNEAQRLRDKLKITSEEVDEFLTS